MMYLQCMSMEREGHGRILGRRIDPPAFPDGLMMREMSGYYLFAAQLMEHPRTMGKEDGSFNSSARQQNRRVVYVMENCSAHSISFDDLANIESCYVPSNTISVLQPVNVAIRKSFKAAFRRLVVKHVPK